MNPTFARHRVRLRLLRLVSIVIGMFVIMGTLALAHSSSTPLATQNDIARLNGESTPLTLHAVSSVEKMIGHPLVVPSGTTTLGLGMRVVGAYSPGPPTRVVYDNGGQSFMASSATIYIWNGVFVNGTTTYQQIMNSNGVAIYESTVDTAPGANATLAAENLVNQNHFQTITQTITGSDGKTTAIQTTITRDTNQWAYVESINGTPVVVNPIDHSLTWLDTIRDVWITISGPSVPIANLISFAPSLMSL